MAVDQNGWTWKNGKATCPHCGTRIPVEQDEYREAHMQLCPDGDVNAALDVLFQAFYRMREEWNRTKARLEGEWWAP